MCPGAGRDHMGQTVNLEIPEDVRAAIQEVGERTGREFAAVASEILTEAVRARRFPGIVFADSPVGRTAYFAGTHASVGDVIAAYNRVGRDRQRLRAECLQLDDEQIEQALSYWRAHRREIEAEMDADLRHAIESVWESHPATRPRRR